jgi:Flp pilus assembly protein TadD
VEHPGDSQVWTSLAKLLRNAGKITEGLEALDRALTLIPHSAEVWSLNAEMLTQNEQFDAARKACKDGEAVCSHDTYLLRARTAWIEAQLRNLPAAVRLMREVLSENSGYAVGWTQLAFWLSEQGELPEAARAFEKLRQLRPYDAWASTQLGLLWLKQGDKPAAKQAFVTALQIEPSDPAAAHNLFDLQLDTGDLSGAGRTLQTMQTHQPGSNTLAVEILLLTRRKDKAAALKALEALSLSPDPEAWAMDAATQAFIAAGWAKPALKTLRRAAHEKACNPQTGAAVVRLLTASEGHLRATLFFCGLKDAEVQRRAAAPLIEGLAASKVNRHQMKRYSALRWLMWRRRTALAGDDAAWGQVGYALIQFNRMRACAKWHSDWRERPAAQPWMLFNLCLALRTVGRYEESGKVARHVLQSWSHREGATDFHLFMAVEEALNGSLEAARHHLGHSIVRENVPYDANLFLLAKSLIEFLEAPAAARRSQFGNTLGLLSTQFSWQKLLFAGRDVRRSFRRAGRVFVREGAGPTARLWFFWKLDWHWLLAPLWLGVTALR